LNSLYLKTSKKRAEDIRQRLFKLGIFDVSRVVIREKDFVYFPVLKKSSLRGGVFVGRRSAKVEVKPRSLRESLKGRLSPGELNLLPSAFDVVGDIAVLDIPKELSRRRKIIAESLLESFRNIKVVVAKTRPVSGDFRVRGVEVIAGESRTTTTHKEHGCLYRLDVASAYFSPRLGGERMRVAEKVKPGECVLVLFAGVGPYAVLIAKKRNPVEVVAVELNPIAVEFMRENVRINKVVVKVVEGDVRTVVPKFVQSPSCQGFPSGTVFGLEYSKNFGKQETENRKPVKTENRDVVPNLAKFDRIIMPLPKDAGDFLDTALPALSKNGVVHFYDFAGSTKESEKKVKKICKKLGYKVRMLESVLCGSYAPGLHRVCVDFKVVGK